MMTAQPVLPNKVGVAPGTTTFSLGRPWSFLRDDSSTRVAFQKQRLYPAGKYPADPDNRASRWRGWTPYRALKGALRGALGIVVTPFEYTAALKNRNYFDSAPGHGPAYAGSGGTLLGRARRTLGAIPTDFQLATVYGNTPVMHSWIPFKQGTFTTPPFVQPDGNWGPNPLINSGIWAAPLQPLSGPGRGFGLGDGDIVEQPTNPIPGTGTGPIDPGTAAVLELKRHQERMYMLGIVSALAVASTAAINVFRYRAERIGARKRTKVVAEPAPVMAGAWGLPVRRR